jgi:hypothetical protein
VFWILWCLMCWCWILWWRMSSHDSS